MTDSSNQMAGAAILLYDRYAGIFFSLFLRLTQDESVSQSLLVSLFSRINSELAVPGVKSPDLGRLLVNARILIEERGLDGSLLGSLDGLVELISRDYSSGSK